MKFFSIDGRGNSRWKPGVGSWVTGVLLCAALTVQSGVKLIEHSPEVSGDPPGQNFVGDNMDMVLIGGAATNVNQGGFGTLGSVYINYDATNLFLGGLALDPEGSGNGLILFLNINSLLDDVTNLVGKTGNPLGVTQLENLSFASPVDLAILLADEFGDGNFPSFTLGDGITDFGQGVFYLGSAVPAVVGLAQLSQFDLTGQVATVSTDDDGNRFTDRWEVKIPWTNLNASGIEDVSNMELAGVILGGTSGEDRYISGNYLGEAIAGTLGGDTNYGFTAVTITPLSLDMPFVDTDGDGMPNWWEITYGLDWRDDGTTNVVNGGSGDGDADGASNLEEFVSGTRPDDASSVFKIVRAEDIVIPDQVDVEVNTEPLKIYKILFADVMPSMPTGWTAFASDANGIGTWAETSLTSTTYTFVDDFGPNTTLAEPVDGRRYYVIQVEQPNSPPVVNAGLDATVLLSSGANLNGSVTDDGQPSPPAMVTKLWTYQSGPGSVSFGDATAEDTTATFTLEGTYVLRLTADDGATNAFDEVTITVTQSTTDTDGDRLLDIYETDTGVYVSPTNTGTDPNEADTDGDGLDDGDEVLGTLAGLDLPSFGCSPLKKNILIEYDWFDDSVDCSAHSHRPTANAISKVTTAFANAPVANPDGTMGIHIIHDYGQGGVFTGGNLINDADGVIAGGVDGSDFLNYKAAHFAANRNNYFHWCLMPHRYNTSSSSSGQAEINGDDLIVSLYCANSDQNVANTIMHELGHNLNLRHGGNENTNYKPNYNSVMNYKYQFPGVDDDCDPPGDGVLDFSSGDNISLNEVFLDENDGICGTTAWDWNNNGSIESSVSCDINHNSAPSHKGCGTGSLTTLHDYNDWANINLPGVKLTGDGAPTSSPEISDCDNPAPMP